MKSLASVQPFGWMEGCVLDGLLDLLSECRRLAAWLLSKRNYENLWNCFVGDEKTITDSSGPAGIAAAIGLGVKLMIFGEKEKEAALLAQAMAAANEFTACGV